MNRFSLAMLMLLTIAANALRSPAANPTTQPQPAMFAERHLRVTGEPNSVERILQHFQSLSDSHDFEISASSMLDQKDDVKIAVDSAAKTVDLSVTLSSPHDDANKAVDQLAQIYIQKLAGWSHSLENQIAQEEEQFGRTQAQIESLKNRHDLEEAQLRKQTGAVDVSPASVRERMASLQTQKESATIELAAKQARSDALALQISKFSGQIQDKIKNDPIAAELKNVVDLQQNEVDRVNQAKDGYSPSDRDHAAMALAEAKAKLLERQEAAADAAGGDIVAGWNRELMTLSVDIAEFNARSKALDDRLAVYANADEYLDNSDQWLAEINDLQKQASTIQEKINSDRAEYERNHVSIDVINSKDSSNTATRPSK